MKTGLCIKAMNRVSVEENLHLIRDSMNYQGITINGKKLFVDIKSPQGFCPYCDKMIRMAKDEFGKFYSVSKKKDDYELHFINCKVRQK